jgi:hypothetical protein
MDGNEFARNQLDVLLNDVDARSIFGKSGPLNWFSPIKTTKGLLKRGFLTEKQVVLISEVFEQYSKLKMVSQKFILSGEGRDLANLLYRFLQDKPKNISTEDRGRTQKFSKIIHSFSEGRIVHVGLFNDAEALICEFPTEIKNIILALEWVHSARRKYLNEIMQWEVKTDTQQDGK